MKINFLLICVLIILLPTIAFTENREENLIKKILPEFEKYKDLKNRFSIKKPADWQTRNEDDPLMKNQPGQEYIRLVALFAEELATEELPNKPFAFSIWVLPRSEVSGTLEKYASIFCSPVIQIVEGYKRTECKLLALNNGKKVIHEVGIFLPEDETNNRMAMKYYFFRKENIYMIDIDGLKNDVERNSDLIDIMVKSFELIE